MSFSESVSVYCGRVTRSLKHARVRLEFENVCNTPIANTFTSLNHNKVQLVNRPMGQQGANELMGRLSNEPIPDTLRPF